MMNKPDQHDLYLMLLSLYFNTSDGETEQLPNEELLQELLEAINDDRPCLGVDQYMS